MNVAAVSPAPSESARSGVPHSLVVADVGGTFARLALAETLPGQAPRLGSYRTYACADHPSLAAILADFTASLGQPMASAVVAIAGLLDGDTLINANLPWTVSLSATRRESGLPDLQLINDFEAVALAIPYLQADTLVPLNGDADPAKTFPALVLGPGTGLGAALRFADGERPVLASEIGHAALGAGNALELHVLGQLLQRWPHVDNERVLSGSGLMNLYPCLCELRGVAPQWTSTEALIAAARQGDDALAVETLQVFCAWLGSLAGDAAIAVGARSVYLAGGISTHVQDFLADGRFRERFLNKGVLTDVLRQVPVWRVEHGQLGVLGAAAWHAARTPAHD
ncbi:glucokinase [Stenotrophomonas indicatrix]|uniref:glucokinase n=1 Tax=Stenotrophomonas indicatrix TaxID=2045451 RepID=UPI000C17AC7E|nr:glucokinase [Stenotrophomonas indicatrix]PII11587.1 glucokinase [Stenotrophomonas indicatrix]PJL12680.1 glucokinase [Stenotrophomonas maltophilia]PJL21706.1 glucokinase [Stenotrophomonas maltophilia]